MADKSNKIDKGFELNYWRLSYRRKYIRTLWNLPLVIFTIIIIFFAEYSYFRKVAWSVIFILLFLIQLIYNYSKWQRDRGKNVYTSDEK